MNSHNTPCRQVRLALGLTQKEFAARVGVVKQTIVDIEGRRGVYAERIPLGLARRMAAVSGARSSSLVSQDGIARAQRVDRNIIPDALRTIRAALLSAEQAGPGCVEVLWEELRDVIKRRGKKG